MFECHFFKCFLALFFPEVEHCRRLQALLEVLDVNEATLSSLPSELHLPVAVTCYWWQKAEPIPDVQLLKALLLGLSIGTSHSPEEGMMQDLEIVFFFLLRFAHMHAQCNVVLYISTAADISYAPQLGFVG